MVRKLSIEYNINESDCPDYFPMVFRVNRGRQLAKPRNQHKMRNQADLRIRANHLKSTDIAFVGIDVEAIGSEGE